MQESQNIFSEQLINSYNKIRGKSTETVEIMTGLLYSTHNFQYAQMRAKSVNHMQGRNRTAYTNDNDQPMPYFQLENNDKKLIEKLVRNLNVYLGNKHNLQETIHKEVINQIKSVDFIPIIENDGEENNVQILGLAYEY